MNIDSKARLGRNVKIGPFAVVEAGVSIGDDSVIGRGAVIGRDTSIGCGVTVGDSAVLGKVPVSNGKKAVKLRPELPPLVIGDGATIGCCSVIYRGSKIGPDVLVADLAGIREEVVIGDSTIVGRSVQIEPNTIIGRRVTIQTSSYITSDMVIEDEVFIGPCCATANDKYMGQGHVPHRGPVIRAGARIGCNATLLPGIEIGEMAIVGAGAVVTRDVPGGETHVGNPGRRRCP